MKKNGLLRILSAILHNEMYICYFVRREDRDTNNAASHVIGNNYKIIVK